MKAEIKKLFISSTLFFCVIFLFINCSKKNAIPITENKDESNTITNDNEVDNVSSNIIPIIIDYKELEDSNIWLSCKVYYEINLNNYYYIFLKVIPEQEKVQYFFRKYIDNIEVGSFDEYLLNIPPKIPTHASKSGYFNFDDFIRQFEVYLTKEKKDKFFISTVLNSLSLDNRDNILAKIEQYRTIIENDIIFRYNTVVDLDYILKCDIFLDTDKDGNTDDYYKIDIFKSNFFNRLSCEFEKRSQDTKFESRMFDKSISEFTYENFLDELNEYLIKNEENDDDINTILSILSKDENEVMLKVEHEKFLIDIYNLSN